LFIKTKNNMSFNLIDAAKGLFSNELVSKASAYLGESENGVTKAISGILPGLLGGIADKAGSNEGANIVSNLAQEQHGSGILGNLGNFFGAEGGGLLNKGAGLLSGLFGDGKLGMLTNLISGFSGTKSASVSSLLSMAAPAVLGFLGKHASENNLNAGGLASLLSSQKANIAAALPAGLNLSSVFGGFSGAASGIASNVQSAASHASHHASEAVEKAGGGLKWLLPLLLLALAAAAVLYFWRGCNKEGAAGGHGSDHDSTHQHGTTPATGGGDKTADGGTTAAAGKVDSLGNFIYDLGETITLNLPNGAGELKVGKNSTEAKLVGFLSDANATVDTVKGNWFDFTNVRFQTGSANLTDESMTQLRNLVAISKGYPTAVFKFGGYTDNTGTEASNIALSQKRAEAVLATVKKLGAAATALAGGAEGYGPKHPIGDNNTPEGKAQNRRVSVRVKSK
jgi:OmpA-OmpF porin, OOP family